MKRAQRQPILSTIAVPIVILLTVCAVLAFWVGRLRREAEWVAHTLEVLYETQLAESLAIHQMVELRGFMLTGSPEYLARLDALTRTEDATLSQLQRLTEDNPVQQARIEGLRTSYNGLAKLIGEERARLRVASPALLNPQQKATLDERQRQVTLLQSRFAEVTAEERRLLIVRQEQENRTSSFLYATLALAAVAIGLGMLFFLRARIAIIRGIYEDLLAERDASAEAERQARLAAEALAEDVKARLGEAQQALLAARTR